MTDKIWELDALIGGALESVNDGLNSWKELEDEDRARLEQYAGALEFASELLFNGARMPRELVEGLASDARALAHKVEPARE